MRYAIMGSIKWGVNGVQKLLISPGVSANLDVHRAFACLKSVLPKQTNKRAKIQDVIGSAIGWIETFGDWSFGTKLVAKTSAQMWNLKAVFVRMM